MEVKKIPSECSFRRSRKRNGDGIFRVGDPAGTRTPDLRLKRALLYQLSYWVIKALRLGKGGAAK